MTPQPVVIGVYAADGAIYIATALLWLRTANGIKQSRTDYVSVGLTLLGAGVITSGNWSI